MESIVNREAELLLINEAFKALTDRKSLLHTPIIDFYGVEGIGKTTILREVEQRCHDNNIQYIWANAKPEISVFLDEFTKQIQAKYHKELQDSGEGWWNQPVDATRTLLKRGPLVMLLDSVDTTNVEQVRWLEAMLRDLVEENTLFFVVVSSKRKLTFERVRSVARKLTPIQVKSLDRESSEIYLTSFASQIELEIRELIFEWTRGYPLAMDVMTHAILKDGLDPRKPQDQQQLLTIIMDKVIDQGILANVTADQRAWYQSVLALLSMPRRFNLVIMQDMIGTFAPELKLDSSLAYIGLPKRIDEATGILNWNMLRAGFSVEAPIRHIFLLKQRIEQPERYADIQRFLGRINKQFANEVSGSDRVRYLREYLYHSTQTGDDHALPAILEQTMQEITTGPRELFVQFSEEFSQDEELNEALNGFISIVLSRIHRRLAELSQESAQELTGTEHLHALRDFFYHLIDDPESKDLASTLKKELERIIHKEPPGVSFELFLELSQNDRFKAALGQDFDRLFRLIRKKKSTER